MGNMESTAMSLHIPEIALALLLVISVVAIAARRANIPYPTAFLLSGTALALIPGLPAITIPPEHILVIFLPPLLMEAAYFTSLRDFRSNLRPILQLAVGLVIATAAAVAFTFSGLIPGFGLAAGFVLGAIVSPPDAVAATAIIRNKRMPARIVNVLKGESLINDATGLVLYQFAVAAVLTGDFSLPAASLHFLWMVVVGVSIGAMLGMAFIHAFSYIRECSVEILSTFVVAYAAYMLGEAMETSGVLAVVTAGLVVGWHAPEKFPSSFRLPAEAVWEMAKFLLSGVVFLLIGLQIPGVVHRLSVYAPGALATYAAIICLVTLLARLAWVFIVGYGVRFLFPSLRRNDPYPSWQNMFIVAWGGMRGVVSLATALALPLTLPDGTAFPYRDLMIFLAVSVIFFTLLVQGGTLPFLLSRLALSYDFSLLQEDWNARYAAVTQALRKISALAGDDSVYRPALERIRGHYLDRLASLGDGPNTPLVPTDIPGPQDHPLIQAEQRIWRDVLETERKTIITLRKSFSLSDDTMHNILRDLDLFSSRFGGEAA